MAGVRRRYCVGVTKIPYADRDVAHAVMTEADPRGFFDIIGANTPDGDDQFPVGSRCTYRVELTDDEAAAFEQASNCRYIHLDGTHTADGGVVQIPSVSSRQFMGADLPGLDEKWHGRDATVAVLDSGVTGQVIGYMDWTLAGRAEFQDNALLADGTTNNHGSLTSSCAVPRGGRLLDVVIGERSGSASFSAEAAGMRWAADNGADVINLSYSGPNDPGAVITDALDYLEVRGVQIFFSTGNDATTDPYWPASYSSSYDNVHSSISWDTQTGERAASSNHNATYSGVGPGVNVLGILPDGTPVQWSGTSASTPNMAQLCARLCTGGTYTPEQAGAALKDNCRDLGVAASEQGGGAYDLGLALDALDEMPLTITTSRRNLLANPSLETSSAGYSLSTRSGITNTGLLRSSGIAAAAGTLYGTTNITGDGSTSSSPDVTITWPTVDVVAGLDYTFATAMRHVLSGTKVELRVEWLDAGGDTVSTSTSVRGPMLSDEWDTYAHAATAPAGATQAVLKYLGYDHTSTEAASLRWDATIIEQAPAGTPLVVRGYFDGDSDGADWDGDPEVSTSILGAGPLEVLSGSAELAWTPPVVGTYVLRYEATNAVGTDSDDVTVTVVEVAVEGVLDGTLPLPTAALTGTVATSGPLAGVLPLPTADLEATTANPGVLGALLPLVTAALTGTTANTGVLDGQLPLPTAALVGGSSVPGALSGTLPLPTADLDGLVAIPGVLEASLPLPTAAIDGTTNTGTLSGTLPVPIASLSGTLRATGTLDATLPLPTGALEGAVGGAGVLGATLPLPTAALDAETANPGVLDASIPMPTAALTGTVTQAGELAATLPMPTAMLSADGSARGQLDATLPALTADLTGTTANPGILVAALPIPTAALAGTVAMTGELGTTLPMVTAALGGDGSNTGTLTAALPMPTASLDGDTANPGALGGTLPLPAADLDGDVSTTGVLGGTLPLPTASLGAGGGSTGTLDATLPMLGADLSAGITVVAVIHGVLPLVTASLTAGVTDAGTLAGTLPMPTAALAGTTGDQESRLDAVLPMPVAALVGAASTSGVLAGMLPLPTASFTTIPPATYEPPLRAGQPVWANPRLRAGQPDLAEGLHAGRP